MIIKEYNRIEPFINDVCDKCGRKYKDHSDCLINDQWVIKCPNDCKEEIIWEV